MPAVIKKPPARSKTIKELTENTTDIEYFLAVEKKEIPEENIDLDKYDYGKTKYETNLLKQAHECFVKGQGIKKLNDTTARLIYRGQQNINPPLEFAKRLDIKDLLAVYIGIEIQKRDRFQLFKEEIDQQINITSKFKYALSKLQETGYKIMNQEGSIIAPNIYSPSKAGQSQRLTTLLEEDKKEFLEEIKKPRVISMQESAQEGKFIDSKTHKKSFYMPTIYKNLANLLKRAHNL